MAKVFLDTNVLVYALDRYSRKKQREARRLLKSLEGEKQGVISTQVLQEFYVASTRKLGADPMMVKNLLKAFENFETVIVTPPLIYEAVECSVLEKVSFWDALIVVAAEHAHCDRLLTEDLATGRMMRGVRVENPFGG